MYLDSALSAIQDLFYIIMYVIVVQNTVSNVHLAIKFHVPNVQKDIPSEMGYVFNVMLIASHANMTQI